MDLVREAIQASIDAHYHAEYERVIGQRSNRKVCGSMQLPVPVRQLRQAVAYVPGVCPECAAAEEWEETMLQAAERERASKRAGRCCHCTCSKCMPSVTNRPLCSRKESVVTPFKEFLEEETAAAPCLPLLSSLQRRMLGWAACGFLPAVY